MSEKIADVIKETENNKADRQEQYFFRTDQLTVGYDGKPLIREINIQLKKGEILTLIGPNGAGKSTILKSITRQLATISGTVYLDKEKMAKMTNKEVSQKLAVVLRAYASGTDDLRRHCSHRALSLYRNFGNTLRRG